MKNKEISYRLKMARSLAAYLKKIISEKATMMAQRYLTYKLNVLAKEQA